MTAACTIDEIVDMIATSLPSLSVGGGDQKVVTT